MFFCLVCHVPESEGVSDQHGLKISLFKPVIDALLNELVCFISNFSFFLCMYEKNTGKMRNFGLEPLTSRYVLENIYIGVA